MNLKQLYEYRFSRDEVATKARIWEVLCKNFFNKYIDPADNILDIGAGYCDFINNAPPPRAGANYRKDGVLQLI